MTTHRRDALIAGVCFLVAAASSIVALALYQPLLGHPDYVTAGSSDSQVAVGALLEVALAITVIGTSVFLYPVVRRQDGALALGYVGGRILEAAMIMVGIVSVLAVVALRQDVGTTADGATAQLVVRALVGVHDATFLMGPGLVIGVNTFLLALLMLRSGLVPRWIATVGVIGGPLVLLSSCAVLLGVYDQVSTVAGLAALPVFVWEMSLAVYLVAKGYRTAALERLLAA